MTNDELNTALYKKLFAELDTYRNWLMQQPPDEILRHTYEFTTKQDIVLALEYNELSNEQAQALLSSPAPLDEIFHDFEQIEGDHMDIIWGCIETRAKDIIESQKPDLLSIPVYPIRVNMPRRMVSLISIGTPTRRMLPARTPSRRQSASITTTTAWMAKR